MTPDTLQFISAACAVLACACALFVAWRANQWRNSDEVKEGFKSSGHRLTSLEGRMTVVETRLDHAPTAEQITGIKGTLARLEGELNGVQDTMNRVDVSVSRIESWLIEGRAR